MFDFESLTGKEAALIEELSGLAIDTLNDPGMPKVKLMAALVLVAKRREGESTTFNKVMDMPLAEMSSYLGFDEEVDEDSDEGKGETSDATETS